MPIFINESLREFHLQTKESSYIFCVLKNGQLGHLYYGKKVNHRENFSHLFQLPNEPIGNATFLYKGDQTFSLEVIKQEYPAYGTTDFREPAFHIWHENGSRITRFVFQSYKVIKGKPKLEGLPATYVDNENDVTTLMITLYDEISRVELQLQYSVFEHESVITRSARVTNDGQHPIVIERILSAVVDYPDAQFEMIHLDGAWIRERHVTSRVLKKGVQFIDSKRGTSSSQHNPFFALKRIDATEHIGDVYGFSLVYSGNFIAGVEVDHYDVARAFIGINPFDFRWTLHSNESFQTPEVVMVYSPAGLNGMSQTYHRLYASHLVRGPWRHRPRPVLINNWEATYFQFHEEKLLTIAESAKELGVELFVLDDGWFEGRNDDTTSLGDWTVDLNKIPNGLSELVKRINEKGLEFGIWIEPEMISEKSRLYERHPDWLLKAPNCSTISHGRNQYILDLTRRDVRDYLYHTICNLLESANITYVKWDMNRNMTEIGSSSLEASRQGEVAHRYILGLYELLERLTNKFPYVLFESCASGGNRFDPGMLYYMPQSWASDNTDAFERVKIQYGTTLVYPISSIGAHVSAVPNHQTGRVTPLKTRWHVAMFGAFGYELDPAALSEQEKQQVKKQISFFKKYRTLLQYGTFYRLMSPFEGTDAAWMVVSEDKREAIVAFYRFVAKPNPSFMRLHLKGLHPSLKYEVTIDDQTMTLCGDELMHIGLFLPPFYMGTVRTKKTVMIGDYVSCLAVLKATE
ncbi:alpha-galactosidase [Anoxybacillus gonensis]|uniref:Alpha-galactosidase n=1 Tax=Anoxybacillus gonensis TaxID=198467 RepID=A0AAW7TFW6_9BACL|nr:alpha-galactosidase [Anoxybacillus gonensis]AKS39187.1 alpha-galactosidase [Anoxybacillus gonensis]KGP61140.1 alpha-galactosidase [Anoxybacillus gonensis]MCX8046903.1 alpha-galactosidase [Anoxybacillus gonensis]MDO0876954.1 alpha-galactosidase [Anoxybacillus gonensis]